MKKKKRKKKVKIVRQNPKQGTPPLWVVLDSVYKRVEEATCWEQKATDKLVSYNLILDMKSQSSKEKDNYSIKRSNKANN